MDFISKAKSFNVRWVSIASELWVDCAARLIIIFANMLNSLTHTQRDTAQKGASSASKSILPAVNIQVMAPTYHGKACGSHATLSSESGSINYFQMHSIQFGDLEPLNLQIFVPASLSSSPGIAIPQGKFRARARAKPRQKSYPTCMHNQLAAKRARSRSSVSTRAPGQLHS